MKIKYNENLTKIYDCYELSDSEINEIAVKIWLHRKQNDLPKRKIISYAAEIKAHKRLYKLHIFRSHTRDADLEEPIPKILDFLYQIVGI